MTFWNDNFTTFQKKNPRLAQILKEVSVSGRYQVRPSKSGQPTLFRVLEDGKQINLHSSYNPEREATRFIDSLKTDLSLNFIAGGFGLGYHLLELVKRVSAQARIIVIEKSMEILRLAFEHMDLQPLLRHPGFSLQFAIDDNEMAALINDNPTSFALNGYVSITFKSLVKADFGYYDALNQVFQKALQEARINLKTRSVFSKRYYRNILDNLPHLVSCPGIFSLENKMQGVPAILVSAGPSLDKNLPLIKTASKRALIIAVATAFRPLLSCGIHPDFVVAVDPDETSVNSFDLESSNEKSFLLFDPSLPFPIIETFSGRNIAIDSNLFLSQWLSRYIGKKGGLGKSLSVAHTGYLFAHFLGCDPIVLTGQDLAFYGMASHCRESYFENLVLHTIQANRTSDNNRSEHFQKYRNALLNTHDIFGGFTQTTLAMDSFRNLFADEIQKRGTVYNATEGGVGIPGARSLSLKEVINRIYTKPRRDFKKCLTFKSGSRAVFDLIDALNTKISTLRELKKQLDIIKIDLENDNLNEKEFVHKMEVVYEFLIQDDDTIRLLQDYAYAEFLKWSQQSHEISIKSGEIESKRTLHAQLKRDRKFLQVLTEAAETLQTTFMDSVKQMRDGSNLTS